MSLLVSFFSNRVTRLPWKGLKSRRLIPVLECLRRLGWMWFWFGGNLGTRLGQFSDLRKQPTSSLLSAYEKGLAARASVIHIRYDEQPAWMAWHRSAWSPFAGPGKSRNACEECTEAEEQRCCRCFLVDLSEAWWYKSFLFQEINVEIHQIQQTFLRHALQLFSNRCSQ